MADDNGHDDHGHVKERKKAKDTFDDVTNNGKDYVLTRRRRGKGGGLEEEPVQNHGHIDEVYDGHPGEIALGIARSDRLVFSKEGLAECWDDKTGAITLSDGSVVKLRSVERVDPDDDSFDLWTGTAAEPNIDRVLNDPIIQAKDAASRSVGFRFFNHIGWFANIDGGIANNPGPSPAGAPNDLDPPICPGHDHQAIGLLDTGVDTNHAWMQGVVDTGPNPPTDPHGTMVAGVLRQAAPCAQIHSIRVNTVTDHVADELAIARGLGKLRRRGVKIAVMAFGMEAWAAGSGSLALRKAIRKFTGKQHGGVIYAAAGNIDPGDARLKVYPAGLPDVQGVAGIHHDTGSWYDWSNGGDWVDEKIIVSNAARPDGYLYTSHSVVGGASWYAKARGTSLLVAIAAGIAAGGDPAGPFPSKV